MGLTSTLSVSGSSLRLYQIKRKAILFCNTRRIFCIFQQDTCDGFVDSIKNESGSWLIPTDLLWSRICYLIRTTARFDKVSI